MDETEVLKENEYPTQYVMPPVKRTRVIPCPNCRKEPLDPDPSFLPCGHILCAACITRATKENIIVCPYTECGNNYNQQEVQSLTQSQKKTGEDLAASNMSSEKAMEDDLMEDPPLDRGNYEPLRWFQEMERMEREQASGGLSKRSYFDFIKTIPKTIVGAARQLERKDLELAFKRSMEDDFIRAKSNYDWQRPVELPPEWNLDEIMDQLCDKVGKHNYIEGFYACNERNKIVLDIKQGFAENGKQFLKDNFTEKYESVFELAEQDEATVPVVSCGNKIAAADQLPQEFQDAITASSQNNHTIHHEQLSTQNEEHKLGTVTCLAETRDPNNRFYALTTKHAFVADATQPATNTTPVISHIAGDLKIIGDSHTGYMGPIRRNGNQVTVPQNPTVGSRANKAVDIAAVPLNQETVNQLEKELLVDLKEPFRADNAIINGVKVIKRGATSGDTSGYIFQTDYHKNRSGIVQSNYMCIAPNKPNAQFAKPGDSGSLVWGINKQPIGIVVEHNPGYNHNQNRLTSAFAIRMDDCVDTLTSPSVRLPITRLLAYGGVLPADLPRETLNDVDDIEGMAID